MWSVIQELCPMHKDNGELWCKQVNKGHLIPLKKYIVSIFVNVLLYLLLIEHVTFPFSELFVQQKGPPKK